MTEEERREEEEPKRKGRIFGDPIADVE